MTSPAIRGVAAGAAILVIAGVTLRSDTGVSYRFAFPEPEHHWTQVEATFTSLGPDPLELRMSRSSPGRYALHDFAKNVYDVEALGPDGATLPIARPDEAGWTIASHGSDVTVRYKVFGDMIDGTYVAIDRSHAHLNMPAVIMWARGLDTRPARLTFVAPQGASWQPATQLFAAESPLVFTAPNLQYLMDSPVELGPVVVRPFTVDGHVFRFAVHHTGTDAEVDGFVGDVQKIVAAERDLFGEFPTYEPGYYTFIADYLPSARGDGMEHRNSTVMTSASAMRSNRSGLLGTVAHEFFHSWNVERIRPRSLEPFDFDRANMSGELWMAEGFTQYYAPLAMSRAGVSDLGATIADMNELLTTVLRAPGWLVRSAEDMSRMAPFTDGGRSIDRTNWTNTYISYYSFGGALALALDLSLREHYGGRLSLDDFMRAMWRAHGRPAADRPGYVAHPYSPGDPQERLAEITGDSAFAADFFSKYVRGRDVPDFRALLAPAGLVLRRQNPGRAWWGDVDLQAGARIASTPLTTTPAYRAGLDVGDQIRQIDGTRILTPEDVASVLRRHRPGDALSVLYADRTGASLSTTVTLEEDPRLELVAVESTGGTLTRAERAFRDAWLGHKGS